MRILLDRPVEMRSRNQMAEVGIALLVLGQQHQPVDRSGLPDLRRPGNGQHRADDRLDALADAGVAEGHRRIEAVAVGQRDGREAELRGALGDRLRLHRAFEHREGGEDAKRNVGLGHNSIMASRDANGSLAVGFFHSYLAARPGL